MSETLLQSAPETLTKRKRKICLAFIPAIIYYLVMLLLIVSQYQYISYYASRASVSFYGVDFLIMRIIPLAFSLLFTFVFIIFCFVRKPKALLPISFSAIFIVPIFFNLVTSIIYSATNDTAFYNASVITPQGIISLIVCAGCLLFAFEAPALKKFLAKTKWFWAVFLTLVYYSNFIYVAVSSLLSNMNSDMDIFRHTISSYIMNMAFTWLEYTPVAIMVFLLVLWLADPYKKVKPQAPAPEQTVYIPEPMPMYYPPAPVPTVADELTKYKTLLDSGAITREEFDKLKADMLK